MIVCFSASEAIQKFLLKPSGLARECAHRARASAVYGNRIHRVQHDASQFPGNRLSLAYSGGVDLRISH